MFLNLCVFGQRNCWTDSIGDTMYCFDINSYNNDCDLIDQISIKCIVVDRCDALLWAWGLYIYYFGGARSKGFAMLRNASKFPFFDKIGHAKSVGFRFYSAI